MIASASIELERSTSSWHLTFACETTPQSPTRWLINNKVGRKSSSFYRNSWNKQISANFGKKPTNFLHFRYKTGFQFHQKSETHFIAAKRRIKSAVANAGWWITHNLPTGAIVIKCSKNTRRRLLNWLERYLKSDWSIEWETRKKNKFSLQNKLKKKLRWMGERLQRDTVGATPSSAVNTWKSVNVFLTIFVCTYRCQLHLPSV